MNLSPFYEKDWLKLLHFPTFSNQSTSLYQTPQINNAENNFSNFSNFQNNSNYPIWPEISQDEAAVQELEDQIWEAVPLLRRLRNAIAIDLTSVHENPQNEKKETEMFKNFEKNNHIYTKTPTFEVKKRFSDIHSLLSHGLSLLPTAPTTQSMTWIEFDTHPLISSIRDIIFGTLNPFKTSGWTSKHVSHNTTIEHALITTILQLLFNIIQFILYIIRSNHFERVTDQYLILFGHFCRFFFMSQNISKNSIGKFGHFFEFLNVDKPLLYCLLVYSDKEQHCIMLNLLHRLFSHSINNSDQNLQNLQNLQNYDSFSYNPFLFSKLFSSDNDTTDHIIARTWLPLALTFPEQLRQANNIKSDIFKLANEFNFGKDCSSSHFFLNFDQKNEKDSKNSTLLPTPNSQTQNRLSHHTNELIQSRTNFIQLSLDKVFSFERITQKNGSKDEKINVLSSIRSETDSIDCLCHQTTYNIKVDVYGNDEEDNVDNVNDFTAFFHDSSTGIIIRDSYDEHEGIYNILNVDLNQNCQGKANFGAQIGVFNFCGESNEKSGETNELMKINNSLYKLPKMYTKSLLDAYCDYNWGYLFDAKNNNETNHKNELKNKIDKNITKIKTNFSSYDAFICTFGSCCGFDNNNQHIIYFVNTSYHDEDSSMLNLDEKNIEIWNKKNKNKFDIIPFLPIHTAMNHLISSTTSHDSYTPIKSPNVCGHWPAPDAKFFKNLKQKKSDNLAQNLLLNSPPNQDHLRCPTCYNSLPYLLVQYTAFPYVLCDFYGKNDIKTQRDHWFSTHLYAFDHYDDNHTVLETVAKHFVIDFLTQMFLGPTNCQNFENVETRDNIEQNTNNFEHIFKDNFNQQLPRSSIINTCRFLLDIINDLQNIVEFYRNCSQNLHKLNEKVDQKMPISAPFVILFIDSKILTLSSLLVKFLYFITELVVDKIDQINSENEKNDGKNEFNLISNNTDSTLPVHLSRLFTTVIGLWYMYSLLWKTNQLQMSSIHRFSPIQNLLDEKNNANNNAKKRSEIEQSTNLSTVPKTTLTCTSISQLPILYCQPLIYAVCNIFELVSTLFPEGDQAWEKIKKEKFGQQKSFSFGNINNNEQNNNKKINNCCLNRKDFWIQILTKFLPSFNLDNNLVLLSLNVQNYFSHLDSSLMSNDNTDDILNSIDVITKNDIDNSINNFVHLFTRNNDIIDVNNLAVSNLITLSKRYIHKTIQITQGKEIGQQNNNKNGEKNQQNLPLITTGQLTVTFTQMLAQLINLLQTVSLLDISFAAGTELDPSLDGEGDMKNKNDKNGKNDEKSKMMGEYLQNDMELYPNEYKQCNGQDGQFSANNDNINSQNDSQKLKKKQLNINHSPRLYKTIILTALTNIFSSIPSAITMDYEYIRGDLDIEIGCQNPTQNLPQISQFNPKTIIDPYLYDISNVCGSLGLLETVLPLLVIDQHNPVAREWGIIIVKLLTTKLTAITSADGDKNDTDDGYNRNDDDWKDGENMLGKVGKHEKNDEKSDQNQIESIVDSYTDNQKRLYYQSEMSKRFNDELQANSKHIYQQQERFGDENNNNNNNNFIGPKNEQDNYEYQQQVALRDEILNTPGVRIVTGWEPEEMIEQEEEEIE